MLVCQAVQDLPRLVRARRQRRGHVRPGRGHTHLTSAHTSHSPPLALVVCCVCLLLPRVGAAFCVYVWCVSLLCLLRLARSLVRVLLLLTCRDGCDGCVSARVRLVCMRVCVCLVTVGDGGRGADGGRARAEAAAAARRAPRLAHHHGRDAVGEEAGACTSQLHLQHTFNHPHLHLQLINQRHLHLQHLNQQHLHLQHLIQRYMHLQHTSTTHTCTSNNAQPPTPAPSTHLNHPHLHLQYLKQRYLHLQHHRYLHLQLTRLLN